MTTRDELEALGATRERLVAAGWADAADPGIDERAHDLTAELGPVISGHATDWLRVWGVAENSILLPMVRLNTWLSLVALELAAGCATEEMLHKAIGHVTVKLTEAAVNAWLAEQRRERGE